MYKSLTLALLFGGPGLVSAQPLDAYFTEELGGVYTQDWSGRIIGQDTFGEILVFIRGDGKSGDFYGVLSIDCATPSNSKWVSAGSVVSTDTVPAPAINAVRDQACGS